MSKKSEFNTCGCCDVVCPTPNIEVSRASFINRFVGYKKANTSELYTTQTWNEDIDGGAGAQVFPVTSGEPGDLTEALDPGDHESNSLVITGVGGGFNLNGVISMFFQYDIEVNATRTTNEVLSYVSGEIPGNPVIVDPVVTFPVIDVDDGKIGSITTDVTKYGTPSPGTTSESFNSTGNSSFSVVQDSEGSSSFNLITRLETEVDITINSSNTYSNGLTHSINRALTDGVNVNFSWVDAAYTTEINESYMCDNFTIPNFDDSDFSNGGSAVSSFNVSNTLKSVSGVNSYDYKELSGTQSRIRLQVPDSFSGSYFAARYDLINQDDVVISTETIEWLGAGDINDPESWFSDYLLIPMPEDCEDGAETRLLLKDYRCFHGGRWQSFV